MSEEKINQSEELTKRINNAYMATDYTLLNGGIDNIVMMKGEREGGNPTSVDILLTYDGMTAVVESLKSDTEKKEIPQEEVNS